MFTKLTKRNIYLLKYNIFEDYKKVYIILDSSKIKHSSVTLKCIINFENKWETNKNVDYLSAILRNKWHNI